MKSVFRSMLSIPSAAGGPLWLLSGSVWAMALGLSVAGLFGFRVPPEAVAHRLTDHPVTASVVCSVILSCWALAWLLRLPCYTAYPGSRRRKHFRQT